MRYKSYLSADSVIADVYETHPLSTLQGINLRDHNDVQRSNGLLVNLTGADRVSIGTMIELGWADAYRKPVVIAMEEGNIHWHAMVRDRGLVVSTLEEATELIGAIISTDQGVF